MVENATLIMSMSIKNCQRLGRNESFYRLFDSQCLKAEAFMYCVTIVKTHESVR